MEEKYSIAKMFKRLEAHWPEAATPETGVMLGLIRINDLFIESSEDVMVRFGLTQAAFEVLTTLRSYPKPRQLTPTELYKSILITSGGMTKVLNQLEHDGLIQRLDNPEDKRSKIIKLTRAGEKVAEQAMKAIMENDRAELGKSLSKSDVKDIKKLLLKILGGLE